MPLKNSIVINFPQGSGGHLVGRLLASCDNVVWYDHAQNGDTPWEPYVANDKNYSKLHFNRRFKGASNSGPSDQMINSVLDIAEKQNRPYNKQMMENWKEKLFPMNFVYPLHADLDVAREFFHPAKHIVIIPSDIELLVDRWMISSYNYFVDGRDPNYLYRDLYQDKADRLGISLRECLTNDLSLQLENYRMHITESDVVIDEVEELYSKDFFISVCEKFNLSFNYDNYKKVVELCWEYSHL